MNRKAYIFKWQAPDRLNQTAAGQKTKLKKKNKTKNNVLAAFFSQIYKSVKEPPQVWLLEHD